VLRVDGGTRGTSQHVRGAALVAGQAVLFAAGARFARPALVNGTAGVVSAPGGRATAVLAFTIIEGRIHRIDILADSDRLAALLPELDGPVDDDDLDP
jgi:hypothetical protein